MGGIPLMLAREMATAIKPQKKTGILRVLLPIAGASSGCNGGSHRSPRPAARVASEPRPGGFCGSAADGNDRADVDAPDPQEAAQADVIDKASLSEKSSATGTCRAGGLTRSDNGPGFAFRALVAHNHTVACRIIGLFRRSAPQAPALQAATGLTSRQAAGSGTARSTTPRTILLGVGSPPARAIKGRKPCEQRRNGELPVASGCGPPRWRQRRFSAAPRGAKNFAGRMSQRPTSSQRR